MSLEYYPNVTPCVPLRNFRMLAFQLTGSEIKFWHRHQYKQKFMEFVEKRHLSTVVVTVMGHCLICVYSKASGLYFHHGMTSLQKAMHLQSMPRRLLSHLKGKSLIRQFHTWYAPTCKQILWSHGLDKKQSFSDTSKLYDPIDSLCSIRISQGRSVFQIRPIYGLNAPLKRHYNIFNSTSEELSKIAQKIGQKKNTCFVTSVSSLIKVNRTVKFLVFHGFSIVNKLTLEDVLQLTTGNELNIGNMLHRLRPDVQIIIISQLHLFNTLWGDRIESTDHQKYIAILNKRFHFISLDNKPYSEINERPALSYYHERQLRGNAIVLKYLIQECQQAQNPCDLQYFLKSLCLCMIKYKITPLCIEKLFNIHQPQSAASDIFSAIRTLTRDKLDNIWDSLDCVCSVYTRAFNTATDSVTRAEKMFTDNYSDSNISSLIDTFPSHIPHFVYRQVLREPTVFLKNSNLRFNILKALQDKPHQTGLSFYEQCSRVADAIRKKQKNHKVYHGINEGSPHSMNMDWPIAHI